jgi:hypothetical protein
MTMQSDIDLFWDGFFLPILNRTALEGDRNADPATKMGLQSPRNVKRPSVEWVKNALEPDGFEATLVLDND